MVKNEDSNVPAEETAKKSTRARAPKKADTDTAAPAKKSLIKKAPKAKAEKSPASVDEVVEKATKKAPAKRGSKAKADAADNAAEVKAPAVAAPVSATSLMFMAPDLPPIPGEIYLPSWQKITP